MRPTHALIMTNTANMARAAAPAMQNARAQRAAGRREVEVGAGLGLHGAVHVISRSAHAGTHGPGYEYGFWAAPCVSRR